MSVSFTSMTKLMGSRVGAKMLSKPNLCEIMMFNIPKELLLEYGHLNLS